MIINEYTDKVFDILSEELTNVKVIKAYPLSYKPTRMNAPVATVSPQSMEQKSIGLGEYASDIDITMSVDVFVPYNNGISVLNGIVDSILNTGVVKNATKIKLSTPVSSKTMDCISAELLLGYNAYIGD